LKLILHIGTEKTGTTTLQHWLWRNRELLKNQGIWYPKSLGLPNNRNISIYARDEDKPDDGFLTKNLTTPEKHREFCLKTKENFKQEIEEALEQDCRYFIISNEHMHSRLTSHQMVRRVKEFISSPSFKSVQVIAHLRPQIDVAISMASTASTVGKKVTRKFFERIDPKNDPLNLYFNYQNLIACWEEVFGSEVVSIIPFKKIPCLTSFLIESLSIDTNALTEIKKENEAVDVRTMALVNALDIPKFNVDQTLNKNREIFIKDLPKKEKILIGLDLARLVQAKFDDSNRELASRRRDIDFEDLQPNWEKYDVPSNIDILDYQCPFSEQLKVLVQRYNGELKLEQARTRMAQSERAFAGQKMQSSF